jgi:hypothetical protein
LAHGGRQGQAGRVGDGPHDQERQAGRVRGFRHAMGFHVHRQRAGRGEALGLGRRLGDQPVAAEQRAAGDFKGKGARRGAERNQHSLPPGSIGRQASAAGAQDSIGQDQGARRAGRIQPAGQAEADQSPAPSFDQSNGCLARPLSPRPGA